MQRNWIGRSEGARVRFPLSRTHPTAADGDRSLHDPDRHDLRRQLHPARARASARRSSGAASRAASVRATALKRFQAQDRTARMTGEVEKEGFDTGRTAINPFTEQPVPIWVANFVLGRVRHRRGDGRAGARPARLRVRAQVRPADHGRRPARRTRPVRRSSDDRGGVRRTGVLVDSGSSTGCASDEARAEMTAGGRGARDRRAAPSSTG